MFNFTPSTIPHNVFVIGAGGTGGRLIPLLSQFLRSITRGITAQGWVESPNIWLIDDDIVEHKNILRQNFIEMDVGKPKAAVLAERYSRAYGVNIFPIMRRVNKENQSDIYSDIKNTISAVHNTVANIDALFDTSIVIICVDSVQARRDILNTFITKGSGRTVSGLTFFIDSGNEDNFGQISFFTPTIICHPEEYDKWTDESKLPKLIPVSCDTDYIPMNVEYYRNLVDTPAQGSCADLNQTLAINAIMATTIMGVVQNYFYRKPMNYNSISISLDGGNFTTHNTFNEFKNRAVVRKDVDTWYRGYMKVTEKDGSITPMSFAQRCSYVSVTDVAHHLKTKIMEMAVEQERLRMAEEAEKRKLLAKKARLEELRKAREERQKLKEEPSVIPSSPIPVVEIVEAVIATPQGTETAPALEPVGRIRRQVTLEVPEVPAGWTSPPIEAMEGVIAAEAAATRPTTRARRTRQPVATVTPVTTAASMREEISTIDTEPL